MAHPMTKRPVQLGLPLAAPGAEPERAGEPGLVAEQRSCPRCGGPVACIGRACGCVVCGLGVRFAAPKRRGRRRLRRRSFRRR